MTAAARMIVDTLVRRLRDLALGVRRSERRRRQADGAAVKEFCDDEAGYLDWVRRNSGGWVINAGRNLAPSDGLVLHRATCQQITTIPPHTKKYIKFCSTDRSALLEWAQGVDWVRSAADISTGCPFCKPSLRPRPAPIA